MKDKTKVRLIKLFGVAFVLGIIAFLATLFVVETVASGSFNPILLITVIPAIAIVIFMAIFIKRKSESVKSGLPIDDEMSQKIKERAGYLTTLISIWFMIGLMWYNGLLVEDFGFPRILSRHLIFIILIFMLIVFFAIWFVLSRRGIK